MATQHVLYLPVGLSACMLTCLPAKPVSMICLSVRLSVCMSVCLVCLSVSVSVCLSVCLSACMLTCLPVNQSASSVCLYV